MAEDKKTADQGNDDKREKPDGAAAAQAPSSATRRDKGKADSAAKPPGKSSASKTGSARPPRRRGRRWLSLLLVLVVILAAGYYGWRHYGDELSARLGIELPGLADESEEAPQPADPQPADPQPTDPEPSVPESGIPAEEESQPGPAAPEASPASSVKPEPAPDAEERTDQAGAEDAASAEALAAVEKRLAKVERRLQHQRTRLEELAGTTRRDWLLAEAEYLLRLAHQRILTERRAANALALMQTVDGILEELDDPDLFPVRRALAREITQLRGAEDLDREGIFLDLETLIESTGQLEISRPKAAEPTAPPPETEAPWYRQLLDNARQALVSLSGIVRVERLDEPPPPLPTPSETERLRQGVRLALEQAQLGLMREQQAIFDASIERARETVAEHFADTDTGATMRAQLDELAGTRVTRSLPTPDASLRALRDYVRLQHNRYEAGGGNGS